MMIYPITIRNSIAIRQSNNVYNQSLVSSIIENKGLNFTKNWLNGLVKNFSRQPTGNDRHKFYLLPQVNQNLL